MIFCPKCGHPHFNDYQGRCKNCRYDLSTPEEVKEAKPEKPKKKKKVANGKDG
jgi:uncharacterized Zn finger protein (UPF0148 family)